MNARKEFEIIERDLDRAVTDTVQAKRVLSDTLWRLHQIPAFDALPQRTGLLLTVASRYLRQQADPMAAVEPSALAVMLSQQCGDAILHRRALALQGEVLFATGNVGDALAVLSDALISSQGARDHEAEATAWSSLGAAFLDTALYLDADECLVRACQMNARVRPMSFEAAVASARAARCHLALRNFEAGRHAVDTAVSILDRPRNDDEVYSRVLAEVTHTRLLLEIGQLGDAAQRARLASSFAHSCSSLRARLSATLAEAMVRVYSGDVDEGLGLFRGALDHAREFVPALRESLLANIQALNYLGRRDEALTLHLELTFLLRRTQHEVIQHGSQLLSRQANAAAAPGRENFGPTGGPRAHFLEDIALTAEIRDDPTGEHAYRVARLAGLLWEALGEVAHAPAQIEQAARLHDIGKAAVADDLLLKVDPPSVGERQVLKRHAAIGAEMIGRSDHPLRELASDIARFHHEAFDGAGYPEGLRGAAIPLPARVVAVCDAFDAMTHPKPYRPALSIADALKEIDRHRGTQFDPRVVDCLEPLVTKLQHKHSDLDAYLGAAASDASLRVAAMRVQGALALHGPPATQQNFQPAQLQQRRLIRPSR